MVVCIFIIMGPAAFTSAAVLTVNLMFSPELRLARKYLHMVAPEREHSFGFLQVRSARACYLTLFSRCRAGSKKSRSSGRCGGSRGGAFAGLLLAMASRWNLLVCWKKGMVSSHLMGGWCEMSMRCSRRSAASRAAGCDEAVSVI